MEVHQGSTDPGLHGRGGGERGGTAYACACAVLGGRVFRPRCADENPVVCMWPVCHCACMTVGRRCFVCLTPPCVGCDLRCVPMPCKLYPALSIPSPPAWQPLIFLLSVLDISCKWYHKVRSFCVWHFFLLGIMFSKSIHVVPYVSTSFVFITE